VPSPSVSLSASDPDWSEPLALAERFTPATLPVLLARLSVRASGGRPALEATAVVGAAGTSGGRPTPAAAGVGSRHSMHSSSASSAGR